jgi:hypothetical protein
MYKKLALAIVIVGPLVAELASRTVPPATPAVEAPAAPVVAPVAAKPAPAPAQPAVAVTIATPDHPVEPSATLDPSAAIAAITPSWLSGGADAAQPAVSAAPAYAAAAPMPGATAPPEVNPIGPVEPSELRHPRR